MHVVACGGIECCEGLIESVSTECGSYNRIRNWTYERICTEQMY